MIFKIYISCLTILRYLRGDNIYSNPKVVIVGTGPAGLFAALPLTSHNMEDRPVNGEPGEYTHRMADPRFNTFPTMQTEGLPDIDVHFLEKGPRLERRVCMVEQGKNACYNCFPCSIMSGPAGAGGGSDGKVNYSLTVGGLADAYPDLSQKELETYIGAAWDIYRQLGMPDALPRDPEQVKRVIESAAQYGFDVTADPITHMGSTPFIGRRPMDLHSLASAPGLVGIYANLLLELNKYHRGADFSYRTEFANLKAVGNKATEAIDINGRSYPADAFILATGRSSELIPMANMYSVPLEISRMSVGFRVELPHAGMKPLTDLLYEFKAYYDFDDAERSLVFQRSREAMTRLEQELGHSHARVKEQWKILQDFEGMDSIQGRTFCMCPHGKVAIENYGKNIMLVNGFSYYGSAVEDSHGSVGTDNTNFAVVFPFYFPDNPKVVTWSPGQKWTNPHDWLNQIAYQAQEFHQGKVGMQTLDDIVHERPSERSRVESNPRIHPTINAYEPTDLRKEVPIPLVESVQLFLERLREYISAEYGINIPREDILVYGIEGKRTALRFRFGDVFDNVEAAGDMDKTRGILQASAAGLMAGNRVKQRLLSR